MQRRAAKKIRKFKSEKEEAEFWATHDSVDYLEGTKEFKAKFARPKKKLVSLRLDDRTINELKKIAERKGIGYLELVRILRGHLPLWYLGDGRKRLGFINTEL